MTVEFVTSHDFPASSFRRIVRVPRFSSFFCLSGASLRHIPSIALLLHGLYHFSPFFISFCTLISDHGRGIEKKSYNRLYTMRSIRPNNEAHCVIGTPKIREVCSTQSAGTAMAATTEISIHILPTLERKKKSSRTCFFEVFFGYYSLL